MKQAKCDCCGKTRLKPHEAEPIGVTGECICDYCFRKAARLPTLH